MDEYRHQTEEIVKPYQPKKAQMQDVPTQPEQTEPAEPDVLLWTPGSTQKRPAAIDDTIRFQPRKAEPFSSGWEPNYDPPAEGYVQRAPAPLRPRSRLGELKQKLREGPEKIYDTLMEKGLFRLQVAIFLSILLAVMAVATVVLHRLDMVRPERMRLMVFGELFAMLCSALLCWERLTEGLFHLFRLRLNLDSLLLCSFTACVADGIFCLPQVELPFCAAFCVECLMCLWAEYQRRSAALDQTDILRRATRLDRVVQAPDCFEGKPGFHVCEGQVEDYMDSLQKPTPPGRALDWYTLAALLLSGALALWVGYREDAQAGVRAWAIGLLAASPATIFLCQTRPLAILQRRLRKFGAVLGSWAGMKAARGPAVVPMTERELFPRNSLKINGMKCYCDRSPDALLGYATAVVGASGECIAPVFEQLLHSHHAQRYEVSGFKRYADRGLGGIVCGQQVLVGSREFLKTMGVAVDPGAKVPHAVYMAIDGVFAGVFALNVTRLKGVRRGLGALCGQRGLTPVVATRNFLVTKSFLHQKFQVDPDRVKFPSVQKRDRLAVWQPDCTGAIPCALLTQEGLGGMALSITGARGLYNVSILGAAFHILAGLLGFAAVLGLTLTGRTDLLTPANLLILELSLSVPGLLITEWMRHL